MLFKLMNCREEYLTGMQELLKGRGHKVIGTAGEGAEHAGDFIEIVIEGTEPGKNDPEICVSYSGAKPGKSPCALIRACKVQGVREAVCTMWQDDGAETPMAAGLPSILLFAEHGFSQEPDKEQLREQFAFLTGSSFDAYMLLGEFDAVPGGNGGDNPTKYLLYQDPMLGLFDGQISGMDVGTHYRELGEKLKMLLKEKEYDAVIGMYTALAEALSLKADLGNRLCGAYRSGNREELLHIAGQEIPACRDKIAEYKTLRGKVWEQESRIFGFEVLDIRLGGLLSRMDSAGDRLQRFLDGELDRLPELEEARLPYRPVAEGETRTLCSCNRWQVIVTASTI